ncbi:unnamed protein product [Allacma fusca]|uniref:Uncharacterized protein n=1 Tax=Allacma fusca TaxID=39272 RepID=A0A8J2JJY3_9HEXA|nr:unnamed protein product [Allacma fusca]
MFLNEYEKWRMRQNPITARLQVGGRSMPSWFSASLVGDGNGNRRGSSGVAPPPPNTAPPSSHNESDYEEIDHLPRYSNTNVKKPTAIKRTCSLCGNANPVVRCEMCNNQIFCGSCNDMYHRHPKRHNHVRKLLEAIDNRPPLPPKSMAPPDAPVPPPRRMKKFGMRSATNSPTSFRKVFFDPMGTLKRQFSNGMEQRPLPPPPKPAPPLPPKSGKNVL